MKVDLPTPGDPEMPIRTAAPVRGRSLPISARARVGGWGGVDWRSVSARAGARRSPAITESASRPASLDSLFGVAAGDLRIEELLCDFVSRDAEVIRYVGHQF